MRKINLDEERQFENKKATGQYDGSAQSKYYWSIQTAIDKHFDLSCIVIKGKDILEIGCASGIDALRYTRYCRSYVGIDISDAAIKNCESKEINNALFLCIDGHELPFNDESFDCVVVNSLLHHLDLEKSLSQICRVLKTNGVLIFREPLGTNPLINLYRYLTPEARTIDERPFTFDDLSCMKKYFTIETVHYYGFLSLASSFTKSTVLRNLLNRFDEYLSKYSLRYLFWQFSGIARKKHPKV